MTIETYSPSVSAGDDVLAEVFNKIVANIHAVQRGLYFHGASAIFDPQENIRANESIPGGSPGLWPINKVIYDTDGIFSVGTNNQFVVPAGFAYAELDGFISASTNFEIYVVKNGDTGSPLQGYNVVSSNEQQAIITVPRMEVTPGDRFGLYIVHAGSVNYEHYFIKGYGGTLVTPINEQSEASFSIRLFEA